MGWLRPTSVGLRPQLLNYSVKEIILIHLRLVGCMSYISIQNVSIMIFFKVSPENDLLMCLYSITHSSVSPMLMILTTKRDS